MSTKGRGKPAAQKKQQQQQPPATGASVSAPTPKLVSFPPKPTSTEVIAESTINPTSSTSTIQSTRSSIVASGDQQTITQSTLTSVSTDDFLQGQTQMLSLWHMQETASLPPSGFLLFI
jgi:hypothetical protein